jgi:T5SS/PEP-CTERM-associated repeat protein
MLQHRNSFGELSRKTIVGGWVLVLGLGLALLTPIEAWAGDYSWIGGSGCFGDSNCWSPAGAPGTGDAAHLSQDANYTVTFLSNAVNQQLGVGPGNVTLDLGGKTYTLTNSEFSACLGVVTGQGASLTVQGGGVVAPHTAIALSPGSTATLNLAGASASWTTGGSLVAGWNGNGTVSLTEGASLMSYWTTVGLSTGASGTVNISGAGSLLTNTNMAFTVGAYGSGTVNVADGGALNNLAWTNINTTPGVSSFATVSGTGSTWTDQLITVGQVGNGFLTVSDGGSVSCTDSVVGDQVGSFGQVTVQDANSTWSVSGGLTVGASGGGVLQIGPGGTVTTANDVLIGANADGNGAVVVTGNGSRLVTVNSVKVGSSGRGFLEISRGGAVSCSGGLVGDPLGPGGQAVVQDANSSWTVNGYLGVGDAGTGLVNVSGGATMTSQWSHIGGHPLWGVSGGVGIVAVSGAGSTWRNTWGGISVGNWGTGTIQILNGGSLINDGFMTVGDNDTVVLSGQENGVGSVLVSGDGSAMTGGSITIGEDVHGTLTVDGGGSVSSTYATVGDRSGSFGEVTVQDANSSWTLTQWLIVGSYGRGALQIGPGGAVTTVEVIIGRNADGNGSLVVDGAGSRLSAQILYVGDGGLGTAVVKNGGAIVIAEADSNSSTAFAVISGSGTGTSLGTMRISGTDGSGVASRFTTPQQLLVGERGVGRMLVDQGGYVETHRGASPTGTSAILGLYAGASGEANVVGAGSRWTNDGALVVGWGGIGGLGVSGGGTVDSVTGVIARLPGSVGRVVVTGNGSVWSVSDSLYVGGMAGAAGGDGTLEVADEGLVSVGHGVTVWPGGRIRLESGSLVVPHVSIGTDGTLTLSGGSLLGDPTDANLLTSVTSAGLIEIISGTYWLASLDCPDANALAGTVEIDPGATLYVGKIMQGDVIGAGTLVLDSSLLDHAAPAGLLTGVGESAPEPATLSLLALGGLALVRRRRA